jgi:hypothetical protein
MSFAFVSFRFCFWCHRCAAVITEAGIDALHSRTASWKITYVRCPFVLSFVVAFAAVAAATIVVVVVSCWPACCVLSLLCVCVCVAIGPVENIFSQSPCKLQLVRTRVDLSELNLVFIFVYVCLRACGL